MAKSFMIKLLTIFSTKNVIPYVVLAITSAIRGTLREKILQEKSWYRKLCFFFKFYKCQ